MAVVPASSRGVSLSSANTWTANQTAPAWIASGLTGATAASRYVGATTSGAPASGTFSTGDFIIDQTAKVYVCTAGGSPGTWAQAGGGVTVIDYTEFTGNVDISSNSEASPTNIVVAGAHTFDGATLCCIEFYSPNVVFNATLNGALFIDIYDGTTSIGRLAALQTPSGDGALNYNLFGRRYLTPSAASHTYKIGGWYATVADPFVKAGAGGTTTLLPGYIRITSGS